jgi:hypothetical protein
MAGSGMQRRNTVTIAKIYLRRIRMKVKINEKTKVLFLAVARDLVFFLLGFILGIAISSLYGCSSMNHLDIEPIVQTVESLPSQPDDSQTDTITIGEERQALAYFEAYQALIERRNAEVRLMNDRQQFLEIVAIAESILFGGLTIYLIAR